MRQFRRDVVGANRLMERRCEPLRESVIRGIEQVLVRRLVALGVKPQGFVHACESRAGELCMTAYVAAVNAGFVFEEG